MAYCRLGEDSDVYLFRSILNGGNTFCLYLSNSATRANNSLEDHYTFYELEPLLNFLKTLRDIHCLKVPGYAISRLEGESK